jgi:hypothetical protein
MTLRRPSAAATPSVIVVRPGRPGSCSPSPAEIVAAPLPPASGVPFPSHSDLDSALDEAGVPESAASAIAEENSKARLRALRGALAIIAIVAATALFFSNGIPTRQPGRRRPRRAERLCHARKGRCTSHEDTGARHCRHERMPRALRSCLLKAHRTHSKSCVVRVGW